MCDVGLWKYPPFPAPHTHARARAHTPAARSTRGPRARTEGDAARRVSLSLAGAWTARGFGRGPPGPYEAARPGTVRYSRHPNYFGEWMVWNALVLTSLPALKALCDSPDETWAVKVRCAQLLMST